MARPRLLLIRGFLSVAAILWLNGCGGPPPRPAAEKKSEAKPKPAEPPRELTGREAFQQMWVAARSWAPDAQPFRLANLYLENSTGVGGKAAAWTASFASPGLRKWRPYTYSTVKTPNLHLGVFAGHAESFSTVSELTGPPFPVQALKTDSDQAYQVAEEKGGRVFRQKNPKEPVTMVVELSRTMNKVLWNVYYSASPNDSRFTVRLDAATGKFIKVEK